MNQQTLQISWRERFKIFLKGVTLKKYFFDGFCLSYLVQVAYFLLLTGEQDEKIIFEMQTHFSRGLYVFLLGAILSYFLNERFCIYTWGHAIFAPSYQKSKALTKPFYKEFWRYQFSISILVTLYVGALVTHTNLFELLDEKGFAGAQRLFYGLTTPNWKLLPLAIINIVETIYMAFMATVLAIPLAFLLSFVAAKNIMKTPLLYFIYLSLRTVLNVVRSIEALIWAVIFSVWVGIGPFAGMLALMVHSIASLVKQYSEIVESVNEGPIEGIQATGANYIQVIWYAIVPQIILPYISFTVYRWDINVRMATIIGLVGGGGIGNLLLKYQGQAMWPEVGTIILVIAVVVWAMDQGSAHIREALK